MRHLDAYSVARNAAASFYDEAFKNEPKLKTPARAKNSTHVFHQYTLITDGVDRFGLQDFLSTKGIPAMVYYPVPLHMQKAYVDPRYKEGDFPVTEELCKRVISLPMHTELSQEQLDFIVSSVKEFVGK